MVLRTATTWSRPQEGRCDRTRSSGACGGCPPCLRRRGAVSGAAWVERGQVGHTHAPPSDLGWMPRVSRIRESSTASRVRRSSVLSTPVDHLGRTEVDQLGRTQPSVTGPPRWTSLAELTLDLVPRTVTHCPIWLLWVGSPGEREGEVWRGTAGVPPSLPLVHSQIIRIQSLHPSPLAIYIPIQNQCQQLRSITNRTPMPSHFYKYAK